MKYVSAPYWWDDAPREQMDDVELCDKLDAVVIGAGYSGLCTALSLARGGVSVIVVDAEFIGYGASTRNGGMVGPSFHKLGVAGLKNKFGNDRANAMLKESVGFVDFMENFLKAEEIDAKFSRTGRFRGALKPAHFDAMAHELEILKQATNINARMISKSEQSAETGSPLFHGGIVYDYDGCLHPAKYHDGLVQRAIDAGVLIAPETAVTDIEKTPAGFIVKTTRGNIRTFQVAVCTNGYTKPVTKDLRRRVLPIRSAMIATEPLPADLMKTVMPKGRMYGDSRRLVAYYRPSPDGSRILFGGRASGLDDNPKANIRDLRASMLEVYPQLSDIGISHVWSGRVAYTFDHVPHLGRFGGGKDDGLFYAMGYCGSGVARSSYFGTKLGLKMLGKEEGATAFDDLPFETRPLYNGNPWFMPAMLTWHRIADKLRL